MSIQIKAIIAIISVTILLLFIYYVNNLKQTNIDLNTEIDRINKDNTELNETIKQNNITFEKYKIDLKIQLEALKEQIESEQIIEDEKTETIKEIVNTDHNKLNDKELKETVNEQLNKAMGAL